MPFLALRHKEVQDIMVTLFDQERVTELHEYNLVQDARQEGRQEGWQKGRMETAKNLMNALGLSIEQVISALKIPEEEREMYRELLEN